MRPSPAVRVGITLFVCVVFSARGTRAEPLVESAIGYARPAGVSAEFLPTPFGWAHASCIHAVSDLDRVTEDYVEHADGSRTRTSPCQHPRYDRHGRPHDPRMPPAATGGWAASLDGWGPPVQWLSATWTVPPAPVTAHGQILYFFPGLEQHNAPDHILQPVLAWNGAHAPTGWSIYSWKYANSGQFWVSPAVPVNPGDVISGYLAATGCDGSTGVCASWEVRVSSPTQASTLVTDSSGRAQDWVFAGVLEEYGTTACTDLPPSGGLTFSNVTVDQVGGAPVVFGWGRNIDPVANLSGCVTGLSATYSTASIAWSTNATCSAGLTMCSSTCVDLSSDRANCGRCGYRCARTESCLAGSCTCTGRFCP